MTTYKVNELAALAKVTVRTLHHYDEIGLLVPTARTKAGYRLYDHDDLLRLQQILIHRELGFPLKSIKELLEAPNFEVRQALVEQRAELTKRQGALSRLIAAVDAALARIDAKPVEDREIFDGFCPEDYEEEARDRWGQSAAFSESAKRMKSYDDEDLRTLKDEQDDLFRRMAESLRKGSPPESDAARDIAEAHRRYIDRWFYPCTPEAHAGLAQMYIDDARFAETFNAYEPGLADYFAAAIRANVAASGDA
ncbi:MAG: MerR family transcriptional regulator [Myxococcota bacterium]